MGLELAPDIRGRVQRQKAFEKEMLNEGEYRWGYSLGDYADEQTAYGHKREPLMINGVILEKYELFIYDQLSNLLTEKEGDQPVIALDIGGGAGKSWSKLTLACEDDVRKGNIAFGVSNFVANQEEQLANHYEGYTRDIVAGKESELIRARDRNLVHFLTGNLNQIRNQSITLPDGRVIPLRNNVNLASEELAITAWSHTPDLDILKIRRLLSPSASIYSVKYAGICGESSIPERIKGVELARKGLQQDHGLIKVSHAETGNFEGKPLDRYTIFRTPQAPPIELN